MAMSCNPCGLTNTSVSGAEAEHLNSVHNQNAHGSAQNGPSQVK